MRNYAYLRVSHDDQVKGSGLPRQRTTILDYCKQENLAEPEWLVDDGVSARDGFNLKSGKIAGFLHRVMAGAIPLPCNLLVEAGDRLSRARLTTVLAKIMPPIDAGLTIHFIREKAVVSASDENTLISMLKPILSFEASNKDNEARVGRVQVNIDQRLARALTDDEFTFTDRVCKWLRVEIDTGSGWRPVVTRGRSGGRRDLGRRRVLAREDRVPTLVQIFEWNASGLGGNQITARLNADLARWPSWDTDIWHVDAVNKVLRNRAVLGEWQPHRMVKTGKLLPCGKPQQRREKKGAVVMEAFPQVIPTELFERAERARRALNERRPGRPQTRGVHNLFSGMARCATCGRGMQSTTTRTGPYLLCRAARAGACSNRSYFPLRRLERVLLFNRFDGVLEVLAAPDAEDSRCFEPLMRDKALLAEEVARLARRIANLENSEAEAETDADRQRYAQRIRTEEAERSQVQAALAEMEHRIASAKANDPLRAAEAAEALATDALHGDVDARERLAAALRIALGAVRCHPGGRVEIELARAGTTPLVVETDHLLLVARTARLRALRSAAEFRRDREAEGMDG